MVVSNEVGKVSTKAVAKLKGKRAHAGKRCCGPESSDLKLFRCASVEPPSFTKRVDSVTAVLGTTVKLQGTVKGSSPIAVKWMKDSEYLRDDDPSITLSFDNNVASLSIAAVAISHGGKYLCQAENEAGQQKSEATLTVQGQVTSLRQTRCPNSLVFLLEPNEPVCIAEPARIVEPAPSISVTAGDSATLECTISGSPELKVKWFKDGKEMISGRKYKMTVKDNTATMKILSAEKCDSAEYKMQVANKVGKDECTCSLTVLGSLSVTSFEIYPVI